MARPIHIIGTGLLGLSTADSLRERGAEVVLWDAAKAPGQGASFLNSGLIHPSQAMPWRIAGVSEAGADSRSLMEHGFKLAQRSDQRLRERMRGLKLSIESRGLLQIFADEGRRDASLQEYRELGVPAKASSWQGRSAIILPEDRVANAHAYSLALSEDLARRGVEFRLGETVKLSRGKRWRLRTASYDEAVETVVVCAGYRTAEILRGIEVACDVTGVAGHALRFMRPDGFESVSVMDADSHSAMTVFADEVRLSGSVGLDRPDELREIWREIAPDLIENLADPYAQWTGMRPVSACGRPMMGPTEMAGLYINTGHAHMGWTQCAGAGEVVADAVFSRLP